MVLGVVAEGNRVREIELVAVEVPVTNKALGQLLVVLLHLRDRGAQGSEIRCGTRLISVLIQDKPVRMLLDDVRQLVRTMVEDVLTVSVFDHERDPPKRDVDT